MQITSRVHNMLIVLLVTSCLFSGIQSHRGRGHFTIVAPGTIRSNSAYHVSLSLDDFTNSCWFNLTLEAPNDGVTEVIKTATVEVEPRSTKLVTIQLPKLYYGHGWLRVVGYRGIVSYESGPVSIEEREYTTYVQTSKATFKPGEVIEFRVICIDQLTRPAAVVDEVVDVYIYDGQENLIRKFADIKLDRGVFKGELQLSENPVLGEWGIEVKADGTTLEKHSIEVARYVVPKFSVEIDAKKDLAADEGNMVINVKSSYTFGQPVTGNVTIKLEPIYATYQHSTISSTDRFNGQSVTTFNLRKDLNITKDWLKKNNRDFYRYILTATVTEALTGQSQSATTEVTVHSKPHKVKLDAPEHFNLDGLINITVSVTDLQDNPIQDAKSPVNVIVMPSGMDFSKPIHDMSFFENFEFGIPTKVNESVALDENGVGVVSLILPYDETFTEYEAVARYLGEDTHPKRMKQNLLGRLNLDVITTRPKVGEELQIMLRSPVPIDYFIYEIVSRGDIIQSQRISMQDKTITHLLSLNATHSMVPKVTVFVHFIQKGVLSTRVKEVYIQRASRNSMNITADDEVLPGASVSLNVTTDENSYVGLVGIDERLLLAPDYKASLTEDNIFTELHNYDSVNIDEEVFPGAEAGLITFSNARNKAGQVIGHPSLVTAGIGVFYPKIKAFDKPVVTLPRIRKLFADTWLFKDFTRTPKEGLQLHEIIPDTITSWAVTGFSLNPETGLTLTKNATKVRVFQEFFISMDLPNLVKEEEVIEIPVNVFNYMDRDLVADVTFESPSKDLEILDSPSSGGKVQLDQTLTKSLQKNGREKFVFFIKPRKSGRYNLTVKAISPIASDAVQKTLIVEPDGVPYSISKTHLIHLTKDNQEREDEVLVELPEKVIPGSESVQLSVVGDIFGQLMRSLEKLIRVPFGNSENNMRYFVSNLLVLKYLKAVKHSSPSLEKKAKLYLGLGYQTQLQFKHLDGSFSLFDRSVETTGDPHISAYTIWALQQAKNFIQVDPKVIERGLNYLKSKQAENGGFVSGKDLNEDVTLTALSLLAFLVEEAGQNQYQDSITKGLTYLYNTLDDLEHPTAVAISNYALILGKHNKSEELLSKLSIEAALKGRQLQWTKSDTLISNLETTTYAFMSLLESEQAPLQNLYPILQSLVSVRQAKIAPVHMLALEAMIKFANYTNISSTDLNIHFEDDQDESGNFQVNSSNSQLHQQVQLKGTSRRIKLKSTGTGFSLVSVNYKYNSVLEDQSDYQVNVTTQDLTNWELVLDICVATRMPGSQSNVTVMEITFLSGYTVYEQSLERIKETNKHVKSIEGNQPVRLYLENISQNGTCIRLGGTKTNTVFNPKPVSIDVYDNEDQEQRSVLYYKVNPEKKEK